MTLVINLLVQFLKMRLWELFEKDAVRVAYFYTPRCMLHTWLKTGFVQEGMPVWEPAQMLLFQMFGAKSKRAVYLGYKKEIGCFRCTFYRPKYRLLVLGIHTCSTCSEREVALTVLSFVSYTDCSLSFRLPTARACQTPACSQWPSLWGHFHLLIWGLI